MEMKACWTRRWCYSYLATVTTTGHKGNSTPTAPQDTRSIRNCIHDCFAARHNTQFLRSDVDVCRCCRAQVVDAAILRRWKTCFYGLTARLAQSAERKALNLVVVDSSPTVGVFGQ